MSDVGVDETDYIWLAGLFDGEGCISLIKEKPKRQAIRYTMVAAIRMTHEETVRRVMEITKVGYVAGREHQNRGRKPTWEGMARARKAEQVIARMLPYLVTKKEQALIALEFFSVPRPVGIRLTKEALDLQESYYLRLREAKRA